MISQIYPGICLDIWISERKFGTPNIGALQHIQVFQKHAVSDDPSTNGFRQIKGISCDLRRPEGLIWFRESN